MSNFFGWYFTVYAIYQSFALYLMGTPAAAQPLTFRYCLPAVVFYGVSAAGNLLVVPQPGPQVVTDPAGTIWTVGGILGTSRLVSIFVMGAFTMLAWIRMTDLSTAQEK